MASYKDAFEPKTFGANSFASACWRGARASTLVIGQWSNVLALQSQQPILNLEGPYTVTLTSNQPRIELYGQEWVTLGSNQDTVRIDTP